MGQIVFALFQMGCTKMKYTMNFGLLTSRRPRPKQRGRAFRIAVLGDFSGRANAGRIEAGEALGQRKAWRVDVDDLEDVMRQMAPKLCLARGASGGTVELQFESMDDFHPDQLFQRLEVFRDLSLLRQRLMRPATFEAAAAEVRSWSKSAVVGEVIQSRTKSRGVVIPHGKLDDFARLLGRSAISVRPTPATELIKQVVAPHIVAAPSPDQPALVAAVDEALAETMRLVLHHPDFQALESIWRSVELLTRELETNGHLQIVLYDVTAEELAADLSSSDALDSSGWYRLVVEGPMLDGEGEPLSVMLGYYIFEQTPPHAELLGRIGKIAAAAQAPFVAAISPECLKKLEPDEIHPLVRQSWDTLRAMPHARYLALTVPRFMLRWPYGAKTEPIDSFKFEEFTPQTGLKGMLWANGSILVGLLLGKTFSDQGLPGMRPGTIMSIGDVPFYYYTDADGDQIALPNTERLVTESVAAHVIAQHFMPVLCVRGRPEVRLGSFQSLAGEELAGPWSPVAVEPDESSSEEPQAPAGETEPELLTVDEFEAAAATEAQQELDAILAGVESAPSVSGEVEAQSEPGLEPQAADDDLDALLSSLASDESQQTTSQTEIDPELAELLKGL